MHLERISLKKEQANPMVVIKEHLIRYVHSLSSINDKDVLDVACGTGYGMYLMSYFAKTVSGYDNSSEAIEGASEFKYKCNVCLEIRDLELPIPLSNNKVDKFDVVTCFETIEHLENPGVLLSNIRDYLKPKGTFIFSIPNRRDLVDNSMWHKDAFDLEKITKLMEKHFGKVDIKWLGQDQFGFSKDLNKPFLLGKIQVT